MVRRFSVIFNFILSPAVSLCTYSSWCARPKASLLLWQFEIADWKRVYNESSGAISITNNASILANGTKSFLTLVWVNLVETQGQTSDTVTSFKLLLHLLWNLVNVKIRRNHSSSFKIRGLQCFLCHRSANLTRDISLCVLYCETK